MELNGLSWCVPAARSQLTLIHCANAFGLLHSLSPFNFFNLISSFLFVNSISASFIELEKKENKRHSMGEARLLFGLVAWGCAPAITNPKTNSLSPIPFPPISGCSATQSFQPKEVLLSSIYELAAAVCFPRSIENKFHLFNWLAHHRSPINHRPSINSIQLNKLISFHL